MDQLVDFSIASKSDLKALVLFIAAKFKIRGKSKKEYLRRHLEDYILLVLNSNEISKTELNLRIWRHIYRYLINTMDGVICSYDQQNSFCINIDTTVQSNLINDLMQLWKLEFIVSYHCGITEYRIINY